MPTVEPHRRRKPNALRKKASVAIADDADYPDREVFEALRQWRRERSTEIGGPAYLVFSDKTLEEPARVLPESPADLLNVRGIGPAKAQRFGEDAIAIIAKARKK